MKVIINRNLLKILPIILLFVLPVLSFAQTVKNTACDPSSGRICDPLGANSTLDGFLLKILEGALRMGMPIVAVAIIYCGFLFVKARGNPEELTKAKDALLYTLIGAAILLGAWALALLVQSTVTSLGK